MKPFIFAISAAAAALLIGCGTASDTSSVTDITVERGPLMYAAVTDAEGQEATMQGNGVYRFEHRPVYPVTSYGGVIDVNRNNLIDEGDLIASKLKLQTSEGTAATIVTSLAENAGIKTMLQKDFNLSSAEMYSKTPSDDKKIAALSDEIFKYCSENNISDPAQLTLQAMETLRLQIAARIEAYEASDLDAGQLEQALIQNELSLQVMTQTEAEEVEAQMEREGSSSSEEEGHSSSYSSGAASSESEESSSSESEAGSSSSGQSSCDDSCSSSSQNSSAASELTEEQKYVLAYMWNEEKMAKDLYLALNEIWPSQTLYNIATKAETEHQASVEALIEAYDLNITDLDEFEAHYSAEELEAFGPGAFGIAEVQELYDVLYSKGMQSAQDALEVGCMVEVTDVIDLNADLVTVAGVDDLVTTLENLRSGSYNHYWAFDNALKTMGVVDGCCLLGDAYCKTPEEFPSTSGGH